MTLGRGLVAEIRRLDEGELRQLLILLRGLLVTSEQPVLEISDVPGMPTVRYQQKSVRCGKSTCTTCPHGPYWYAHWSEEGRKRSRYIGGELPAEVRRKLEKMDGLRTPSAQDTDSGAAAVNDDGPAARPGPRLRLVTD
ncbi:MAG: DUF6788 family protein [Euzebya sp.]